MTTACLAAPEPTDGGSDSSSRITRAIIILAAVSRSPRLTAEEINALDMATFLLTEALVEGK